MADGVFVIAEAGVNHNGSVEVAKQLCQAAHAAGADAVKFQTFRAQDLAVPGAPAAAYQSRQTGEQDQFAMLRTLELDAQAHRDLKDHCDRIGIEFFSTPFSIEAVDMLVALGVRRLKMPSGELTHRSLLEHAASTRLPLLVSTGMATLAEAREALRWIAAARGGVDGVTFLHCTSAYPAPDEALNLRAMDTLARELGVPVGYSDHSLGIAASVAAAALGAVVVEKHLTLDRGLPGPDHAASLEPREFGEMVREIRRVSSMLGDGLKVRRPQEEDAARVARRSIVAATDIAPGAPITAHMIACRRPATGIPPRDWDLVIGSTARGPIAQGTVLQWQLLARKEGP